MQMADLEFYRIESACNYPCIAASEVEIWIVDVVFAPTKHVTAASTADIRFDQAEFFRKAQ